MTTEEEIRYWQSQPYDAGDPFGQNRNGKIAELQKRAELEKKEKSNIAQGLNPDGSAIRPEYQSLLDPATGMMQSQYQIEGGQIDPTKLEGLTAFKARALGEGPSSWAKLMLEQNEADKKGRLDSAVKQAASSQAGARSGLAMRGGLSMGARERLAAGGMKDLLMARQGVASDANKGRLGILTSDEDTKNKFLMQLPGMETDLQKYNIGQKDKSKEFNIMRALEEKRAKDVQSLEVYKEQQKKWASDRQAEATQNSGGGGGK